ncbi:hypothetical protein V2A84_09625 [Yersinia sp. 2553 StPb PI]|uniref:hypothetical protein n=1 Tax=Yersinia sp. 2553 StPb PI TaxID=3117411 RepID=UPI00330FCE62|nr:hypothetical protein [Yersinia enterocolitica]
MTDEIKTGGPAFPWCGDLNDTPHIGLGMQLRDYMAAKYMQGVSANPERLYSNDDLAEEAYQMADAMIKARG